MYCSSMSRRDDRAEVCRHASRLDGEFPASVRDCGLARLIAARRELSSPMVTSWIAACPTCSQPQVYRTDGEAAKEGPAIRHSFHAISWFEIKVSSSITIGDVPVSVWLCLAACT